MMNARKRVLCVGDSLGLPRTGVHFDDTWFGMLLRELDEYEVVSVFQRSMTTEYLRGERGRERLEYYSPLIVVLQVGIVDCAPRYFRKGSVLPRILGLLPGEMSTWAWKLIKSIRQRSPKYADVSLREFRQNIKEYFDRCEEAGVKLVVVIKIGRPGGRMLTRNPHIVTQTETYNRALEEVAKNYGVVECVDPLGRASESIFVDDGYHLSSFGARLVAEELARVIRHKVKIPKIGCSD